MLGISGFITWYTLERDTASVSALWERICYWQWTERIWAFTYSKEAAHMHDIWQGNIQRGDVQRHLLTDTGGKPFCCTYCGKVFTDNSNLEQHLPIHTGERLYKCDKCWNGFNNSGNIKTHNLTLPGGKPHNCIIWY